MYSIGRQRPQLNQVLLVMHAWWSGDTEQLTRKATSMSGKSSREHPHPTNVLAQRTSSAGYMRRADASGRTNITWIWLSIVSGFSWKKFTYFLTIDPTFRFESARNLSSPYRTHAMICSTQAIQRTSTLVRAINAEPVARELQVERVRAQHYY